jgi:phosphate transport system permease protein
MKRRAATGRKTTNLIVQVFASLAALLGIVVLAWILFEVIKRGASALDWDFFTQLPAPPGAEGGGLANALVGTLLMTFMATLIGVPAGILAGVYMAEYGSATRLGSMVSISLNVMMGIPSIIIGLFVFTLMVVTSGHFSGFAGAVALAMLMLPVVARTTEDMLSMVPASLRESALALGSPRWRAIFGVIFRAAKTGLITGVLLAVARVSGETAPLLFTALNSPYWSHSLNEPTANLTVTIFNYAMSPYPNWQRMAWGASFVIVLGVLLLTLVARAACKEVER